MKLIWVIVPLILIVSMIGFVVSESFAEESSIDTRQKSYHDNGFSISYPANWRADDSFCDAFDFPIHQPSAESAVFSRSVPGMPLITIFKLENQPYADYDDQQYLEFSISLAEKQCDDTLETFGYTCKDYSSDAKIIAANGTTAFKIIHIWKEDYGEGLDIERTSVIIDIPQDDNIWTIQSVNRAIDGEYFVPHGEIDLAINSFKFEPSVKIDDEIQESSSEKIKETAKMKWINQMLEKPIKLEETYTNTKFGFSINYPKDWYVHDEIMSYSPIWGLDSGSDVLVFLSPRHFETETPYIAVSLIKDYYATKYESTEYLDFITDEAFETCKNTKRHFDFDCTNHSVMSVGFPIIDGNQAYGFQDTWNNVFDDGSTIMKSNGITLDVITGKNVWRIVGENFPIDDEYLIGNRTMLESVLSFEFVDSDVILQSDSILIESDPEFFPTCGAGTELVNGICKVIKIDDKPSEEPSFIENIVGFFKSLFG